MYLQELIELEGCAHRYMRNHFRPSTELNTYSTLEQATSQPSVIGVRSKKSQFQLSWTVLRFTEREAPNTSCCSFCVPALLQSFVPPRADDARLSAYASDFIFPLQVSNASIPAQIPQRSHANSVSSLASNTSTSPRTTAIAIPMSQVEFIPIKHKCSLPEEQETRLHEQLEAWRERHKLVRSARSLMSSSVDLPDKQLKALVAYGGEFLRVQSITPALIKKVIRWDLASQADLESVVALISEWRLEAGPAAALGSRGGKRKKARRTQTEVLELDDETPHPTPRRPTIPLSQPSFSPARMVSTTSRVQGILNG